MTENDDLVDYLAQTGSILALAELLDAGADDDDFIDSPGSTPTADGKKGREASSGF